MEDSYPALRVIVFIILLIIDGVFSGSEEALDNLNENHILKKAEEGDKKAGYILSMKKHPGTLFNTVRFVATASAMIVGIYVVRLFYHIALRAGQSNMTGFYSQPIEVILKIVITLIFIFIVLVAGVALPKRIAAKNSERWAFSTIRIVYGFSIVLWPMTKLVIGTSNLLGRIFGVDPKAVEENVTEEEIIMMVSEGHEQGVLEANEAEMINNIFEFNDKEVSDIMTHRKDIVGVDVSMEAREAADMMLSERFSRFPVYEGDIENIIGILHLKDIMRALMEQHEGDVHIRDIMREPYYVPDTQNIDHLFRGMQQKKVHMAIAIDEYGQTAGLVAMEDILEEIVGNIFDEYDVDETYIQKIGDNMWMMRGSAPLDEVGDALDMDDLDEGEFETLNGLIVAKLEHIPAQGEHVCIIIGEYRFEVLSVNNNMIQEVRVTRENDSMSGEVLSQ